VSESVLRDAARHLESGGAGGAAPRSGGQGGGDAGTGNSPPTSTAYCGASQRATYPDPPPGVPPSTRNVEIVAAQYTIDLGDRQRAPVQPTEYRSIGFDLDNTCTTAADPKQGTCRLPSYALGVIDGPGGIDNALGVLIQGVRDQIGDFSSENYTRDVQAGKTNLLLRLQNWNGEADDDEVTFSTMAAAPFDSFSPGARPAWSGTDAWPIASDSLNGSIDNPKFVDTHAYVRGNRLVATLAQAPLRMDLGLSSVQRVRLDIKLSAAFIVCDIAPDTTGSWGYTFEKCTLGGRWLADDFVKQIGQYPNPLDNNRPLCRGTQTYETFKELICSQVDILQTLGSPTSACDSLTLGASFTMKPALLGNVFQLQAFADPCCVPPGCTPGSAADVANNPRYDCCESIGGPDGGQLTCRVSGPPPTPVPTSPPVLPDAGGERPDSGPD
jgi:hypothetical protein